MEGAVLNRVGVLGHFFVLNRVRVFGRASAAPLYQNIGQVPPSPGLYLTISYLMRVLSRAF